MTAKVTIIAQTRIGFLSGLRRFSGGEGAEDAYEVQFEEAAARATVALTRAKELCVILGALDMLGLIGAATVIGSLCEQRHKLSLSRELPKSSRRSLLATLLEKWPRFCHQWLLLDIVKW